MSDRWRGESEFQRNFRQMRQDIADGLGNAVRAVGSVGEAFGKLVTPRNKVDRPEPLAHWGNGRDGRDIAAEKRKSAEKKRNFIKNGMAAALGLSIIGTMVAGAVGGVGQKAVDMWNNFVNPKSVATETTEAAVPKVEEMAPTPMPEIATLVEKTFLDGRLVVDYQGNDPVFYRVDGGESIPIESWDRVPGSLLTVIDQGESSYSSPERSSEHPLLDELPDSVLSEEELAEHGVKIVQVDGREIYIQESAFEPGGLFDQVNKNNRKMVIIAVDKPVLSSDYLNDPRYDQYRKLLEDSPAINVEEYRQSEISYYNSVLEEYEQLLEKERLSGGRWFNELVSNVSFYRTQLMIYQTMGAEQLLDEAVLSSDAYAGRYHTAAEVESVLGLQDTEVMFLGIGSIKSHIYAKVEFDSFGELTINTLYRGGLMGEDLDTLVSAPNPDEILSLNSDYDSKDPRSYPFAAQSRIFMVGHHEPAHSRLIMGAPGLPGWNYSERDTDWLARDSLAKAWLAWRDSGFKDGSPDAGSEWPFVLRVQDGYIYGVGRGHAIGE